MKIVSWNVAGLRACIKKGFFDVIKEIDPDVICLQEVKATADQLDLSPLGEGYEVILNPANKRGYSGTLLASRKPILDRVIEIGDSPADPAYEGRVITVDLGICYLTTAYVPNSKNELERLEERLQWEERMRNFLVLQDQQKPVIYCGDLNVAHNPIDLKYPDRNHFSPGFSDQEREAFTQLLQQGFVDTYRQLHPDEEGAYTYWTYFGNARANNSGWRLDYFVVSERAMSCVVSSEILSSVMGSDHCPIVLEINE